VSDIWKKLNLEDRSEILVIDAPASFEPEVGVLSGVEVRRTLAGTSGVSFLLAFVTQQRDLARLASAVEERTDGDAVVWIAYPKKSSKRYSCDFSRDSGWEPFGEAGFEGVRQVAIDEDWSALRLRRVEYIKKMTRDKKRAMTNEGKARTGKT
jgi:hypothetical protein